MPLTNVAYLQYVFCKHPVAHLALVLVSSWPTRIPLHRYPIVVLQEEDGTCELVVRFLVVVVVVEVVVVVVVVDVFVVVIVVVEVVVVFVVVVVLVVFVFGVVVVFVVVIIRCLSVMVATMVVGSPNMLAAIFNQSFLRNDLLLHIRCCVELKC